MASNLLPVTTLLLTTISAPTPRTSAVNHRRKTSTVTCAGAGNKWWSPIFGWSSDADYINDSDNKDEPPTKIPAPAKFTPGRLTEEKAKRLRKMTMETETFNEVMYHSAVASRLATDFPHSSV